MKKALVTGGCGFLGSSIVKALLERDVDVRILALPNESTFNVDGLDVEILRGNVLDIDDCKKSVAGVDTVFHAAAVYKAYMPDPTPMYRVNMSGTFNMLEAARRAETERVVYTASIVSVGRPEPGSLGDENTAFESWAIDFPYGRSKYHSRELAEDFARWGLDLRVVCPGVVLGPGDIGPTPSGQIIINTAKAVGPPLYTEGGASYVDVRDAAEAHVLAALKGRRGQRYLATAHNLSTLELMNAINRVTGKERRYRKIPVGVARAAIAALAKVAVKRGSEPEITPEFYEYSLRPSFYSNRLVREELGASFRPINETIRDAIDYFRHRGLL